MANSQSKNGAQFVGFIPLVWWRFPASECKCCKSVWQRSFMSSSDFDFQKQPEKMIDEINIKHNVHNHP